MAKQATPDDQSTATSSPRWCSRGFDASLDFSSHQENRTLKKEGTMRKIEEMMKREQPEVRDCARTSLSIPV